MNGKFIESVKTALISLVELCDVTICITEDSTEQYDEPHNSCISERLQQVDMSSCEITHSRKHGQYSGEMHVDKTKSSISIDAHSFILAIHSNYFARALNFSSNKQLIHDTDGNVDRLVRKITVLLRRGQVPIAERIIRSFYNEQLLDGINLLELLDIAEVSEILVADYLLDKLVTMATEMQPADQELGLLMQKLEQFNSLATGTRFSKIIVTVLQKCTRYFCPLEVQSADIQSEFISLSPVGMRTLLASGQFLAYSEQSLVALLMRWFERQSAEMSAETSESILNLIRLDNFSLTTGFLADLGKRHSSLFKRDEFQVWLMTGICFCGGTALDRKQLRQQAAFDSRVQRSLFRTRAPLMYAQQHCAFAEEVSSSDQEKYLRFDDACGVYDGYELIVTLSLMQHSQSWPPSTAAHDTDYMFKVELRAGTRFQDLNVLMNVQLGGSRQLKIRMHGHEYDTKTEYVSAAEQCLTAVYIDKYLDITRDHFNLAKRLGVDIELYPCQPSSNNAWPLMEHWWKDYQ